MKGWNSNSLPNKTLVKISAEQRKSLGKSGRTQAECNAVAEAEYEHSLQAEISQFLNLKGIIFITPRFGKKTTIKPGWPDFTFSYHGKACYIEAKASGGKLSEDQDRIIKQLIAEPNRANVCIAYDLRAVKYFLDQMENEELRQSNPPLETRFEK